MKKTRQSRSARRLSPGWEARTALFLSRTAWGLLIASFSIWSLSAQQYRPMEYEVKAAYLYNFGKFVRWPAAVASATPKSFSICILGSDPFGPVLDSMVANEAIEGRQLAVQRISSPGEAAGCRILYISSSEQHRLNSILASLAAKAILTVSEIPDFSRKGGMVQFVHEGDRVRFEVNRRVAEQAGLMFSSDLLRVASRVRGMRNRR
jgi:hypothetical protein